MYTPVFQEKYPKNASCYEARGHYYWKRNDLEEAMLDFEKTVLIDPSRVNCWIDYVEVLNEAKRYDEAEQGETLGDESNMTRVEVK